MFAQISPTYDRLNHLFSGALDHHWRRVTARELTRGLSPCARILDVATGTGDLARALERRAPDANIIGLDFTRPMLDLAARKFEDRGMAWIEGDGLTLPVASESVDACSIAFGLRNMADKAAALREMRRVTRPGGRVAILEFSQPRNPIMQWLYDLYSFTIMPRLGKLISGSEAYLYLPESIRAFWSSEELARQMEAAGLRNIRMIPMTGGVVRLHIGEV